MDDQRRSLIITAVVTLLILALIVGLVLFLVRFVQNRPKTQANSTTISSSASPIANASAAPGFSGASARPGTGNAVTTNIYAGDGFSIKYPRSWGLLTCSNSENFELDPISSADQLKYPCDRAVKPVTVIVGDVSDCQGDTITLGGKQVIKSKVIGDDGQVDYRWCTKTAPGLDVTHRVSKAASRATSTQDYSMQIEQMIASFTPGS